MNHNTQNKLVIITGGTQGIGKAIAENLCSEYCLALIYRCDDESAASCLAELSKKSKHKIAIYKSDVSNKTEVKNTYQNIQHDFSIKCSVLINSAGISIPALAVLQPIENFEYLMSVNYFGVVYWCREVVNDMIRNKFGRIINISSISAINNIQGLSAYSPTKTAVEKFTYILGGEVSKYGITANIVRPGVVESKMSLEWLSSFDKNSAKYKTICAPSGKLIEASSVAKAVRFMIDSAQINCTAINVDGGNSSFTPL